MSFSSPAPQVSPSAAVESYTSKHLLSRSDIPKDALEHALSESKKSGLPPISVSPSQGKFLKIQCQLQGAKNILEIGTLGGYSTIWFASAGKDVHVVSIEINPKHRDVAVDNIKYAGLSGQVDVVLGAALDVLPEFAREIEEGKRPKFDFAFIDADWDEQWDYFDWAAKMTNKGGCIYVDNVVKQLLESGMTDDGAEEVPELVERVGRDIRVDAVVMQTVGAKSHDGFLMAVVK
jgi:predicted O-methyltransferase YrrM